MKREGAQTVTQLVIRISSSDRTCRERRHRSFLHWRGKDAIREKVPSTLKEAEAGDGRQPLRTEWQRTARTAVWPVLICPSDSERARITFCYLTPRDQTGRPARGLPGAPFGTPPVRGTARPSPLSETRSNQHCIVAGVRR